MNNKTITPIIIVINNNNNNNNNNPMALKYPGYY